MKGHSYNPNGCPKCGKVHVDPFKGRKHTEEAKRISAAKISAAKKGRPNTEEHNTKIGNALRGVPKSEIAKQHMSEAQQQSEHTHPEGCRCGCCLAAAGMTCGENNSFFGKHHQAKTIEILSRKTCDRLANASSGAYYKGKIYSEKNQKFFTTRSFLGTKVPNFPRGKSLG